MHETSARVFLASGDKPLLTAAVAKSDELI